MPAKVGIVQIARQQRTGSVAASPARAPAGAGRPAAAGADRPAQRSARARRSSVWIGRRPRRIVRQRPIRCARTMGLHGCACCELAALHRPGDALAGDRIDQPRRIACQKDASLAGNGPHLAERQKGPLAAQPGQVGSVARCEALRTWRAGRDCGDGPRRSPASPTRPWERPSHSPRPSPQGRSRPVRPPRSRCGATRPPARSRCGRGRRPARTAPSRQCCLPHRHRPASARTGTCRQPESRCRTAPASSAMR